MQNGSFQMGDVFIKDPNLGVGCGPDVAPNQNAIIGPATFSYTIVNDSDDEAYVSMVAAINVSTRPDPVFTEQDLQRFLAPHSSFARDSFSITGRAAFDQTGQITATATLTFTLYPSGQVIFSDSVVCQFNVVDPTS
jgi:hypothetical protein